MKRVVVPATAAVLVLAVAAVAAWLAVVGFVRAEIPVQARLARALIDAHATLDEAVIATLRAPGVHVFAIDPLTGMVIDSGSGGTRTQPLRSDLGGPPPGDAAPGAPPGAPPPNGPPPGGGPGGPPPGGGVPGVPPFVQRTQPGPLASLALALAGIAPAQVTSASATIVLVPDARELSACLGIDLAIFFFGAAAIVTFAGTRVAAEARAERGRLEAQARERGEAAERYKRFLADTGHELRTPLTVMAGYVDILRAAPVASLDARILEGMHAETSRMRVLVEKMMTLARLESSVAVPRLLDLATATREAALTVQRRYPEREIAVEAEQTASIVIDADDFSAALGNILENAVKYAPGSPIAVATTVGDGRATASVADRGPGILPAEQTAIFERFQRGEGRAFGEGLGLGLAIVKRVADRWNGSVACSSSPGNTVFRLTFPVADEERHGIAR